MIVSLSLITEIPLPTIGRSIGDDVPPVFRGAPRKTGYSAQTGEDSNGTSGEYCSGTDSYTYDFGDNWQHTVTVQAVEDGNPRIEYPRFIDGERRAPPEDVGSTSGFEEFLRVMAKPRHPQHREFVRWYGGRFDPVDISVDIIQDRVAKLARRRTLGKAGFAKSQNQQH
ncbi:plasmid pRiA4b ORF-3 family protein [Ensifer sp. 2YAB10]|uniref:plasmid pRiA4b ORF-3 family protein n=1 Tax=unclassified Ensifer TaxID=2633371 RepID=UPI003F90E9FD